MIKNYYEILGISKYASIEDVKSAYRKLSIKFHPDKNNGDTYFENMFIQIQEAYEILADIKKREEYDKYLDSIADKTQHSNKNENDITNEVNVIYKKIEFINERSNKLTPEKKIEVIFSEILPLLEEMSKLSLEDFDFMANLTLRSFYTVYRIKSVSSFKQDNGYSFAESHRYIGNVYTETYREYQKEGNPIMLDFIRRFARAHDDLGRNIGTYAGVKKSEGCFVATYAYEDYNHEKVIIFRKFRDEFLSNYVSGRFFIDRYYKYSPSFVDYLNKIKFPKKIATLLLDRLIPIVKLVLNKKK